MLHQPAMIGSAQIVPGKNHLRAPFPASAKRLKNRGSPKIRTTDADDYQNIAQLSDP